MCLVFWHLVRVVLEATQVALSSHLLLAIDDNPSAANVLSRLASTHRRATWSIQYINFVYNLIINIITSRV